MERFGIRRVVAAALAMVSLGAGLTLVMTEAWQLWFLWGVPVGVGTGAMALVFGAIVANRWFVRHRGLVTGVFSAGSSTGQLIFLPLIAQLADGPGWRWAAAWWRCSRCCSSRWCCWCCATGPRMSEGAVRRARVVRRTAGRSLRPGAAIPRGDHPARGQPSLDLLGAVPDVLDLWLVDQRPDRHPLHPRCPRPRHAGDDRGRAACADRHLRHRRHRRVGWLTDKVDSRYLLFGYYFLRGLSLLVVPVLLGPHVQPSLFLFIVFYGLDWVATVPPTVALCRDHFGLEKSGVVFGWVFAVAHGRRGRRRVVRRLDPAGAAATTSWPG